MQGANREEKRVRQWLNGSLNEHVLPSYYMYTYECCITGVHTHVKHTYERLLDSFEV